MSNGYWSKKEIEILKTYHGKCLKKELLERLYGRTLEAIKQKARRLGFKNNVFRLGSDNHFYGKHHSKKAKEKMSRDRTISELVISLPNDKYTFLIGDNVRCYKNGKVISGQKITRRCEGCGNFSIINTTFLKYGKHPEFCRECSSKLLEYREKQKNIATNFRSSLTKEERQRIFGRIPDFNTRRKSSMTWQNITDIADWPGFLSKSANKYNEEFVLKWKIWRDLIYQRDNFTCQFDNCPFCGNKRGGIKIAPHHISPKKTYPLLTFDVQNGITLCEKVHVHMVNRREEEFYSVFKKKVLDRTQIGLVLFDLDGVLVDMCRAHYECLNRALDEVVSIKIEEKDYEKFNGLPTMEKLKILSKTIPITEEDIREIFNLKQLYTVDSISCFRLDEEKIKLFRWLNSEGIVTGVVTNSIQKTAYQMLENIGVKEFCDIIITNNDVVNPKPSSEPYIKAMVSSGFSSNQTLIVEDSEKGIRAAKATGAKVWEVKCCSEVVLDKLKEIFL